RLTGSLRNRVRCQVYTRICAGFKAWQGVFPASESTGAPIRATSFLLVQRPIEIAGFDLAISTGNALH
ncbi:hypothetical protein ABTM79_19215, partial [Acinetobacter baumannii]